jgi:membrane protein implicated in regulation of membrane protease activity
MLAAIAALGPWTWIIAGLLMMAVELLAPGLFFIWLGLAALAAGVAVAVFGFGWTVGAMLFATFAVGSVLGGRALMRARGSEPETATRLNALSRNLIGQVVQLEHAIENGKGRIRIGDTVWQAAGANAAAGDMVRIVRLDGSSLVVERAD